MGITEDDAATRDAITELLEDEGYFVASAVNGLEALDRLRATQRPCLILLDLVMPVMSGVQFLEYQQRDLATADIPVFALSASSNLQQKVEELPIVGYLLKPVSCAQLFGVVEQYCDTLCLKTARRRHCVAPQLCV